MVAWWMMHDAGEESCGQAKGTEGKGRLVEVLPTLSHIHVFPRVLLSLGPR